MLPFPSTVVCFACLQTCLCHVDTTPTHIYLWRVFVKIYTPQSQVFKSDMDQLGLWMLFWQLFFMSTKYFCLRMCYYMFNNGSKVIRVRNAYLIEKVSAIVLLIKKKVSMFLITKPAVRRILIALCVLFEVNYALLT